MAGASNVMIGTELPCHAKVVVIGAGVTGICASLFFADRGIDVTVIDRAMPWSEASGVNAGTLLVQGDYVETIPLTQ
jgi:glycine/D-amino acid oxidase-like deaminating enzyme